MEKENKVLLYGTEPNGEECPMILEEEIAQNGDRPNTCRFCAGSSFC